MCVIYSVRAYTVCENDSAFEGLLLVHRLCVDGDQVKEGLALREVRV